MSSGLVFDIKRFSIHDGPGIRTTVFLKGCPLSCFWCHNPESQDDSPQLLYRRDRCILCGGCIEECPVGANAVGDSEIETDGELCIRCGTCVDTCPAEARELVGKEMTVQEVVKEVQEDQLFFDESGGGVTFSGGEPLMQSEFLLALLDECGELGIHRAVDTSGYTLPDVILKVARQADLLLYDLKHVDSEKHLQFTGVPNELPISNLKLICDIGCSISVRIPLIPGFNDDELDLAKAADLLTDLEGIESVCLLPFHEAAADKHRRFGIPYLLPRARKIDQDRIAEVIALFRKRGLRVQVGGG